MTNSTALRLFLEDGLRLCEEARAAAASGREGGDVTPLYRAVHSLKGAAQMIAEGRHVAELLHALESEIAERMPALDGTPARTEVHPEWLVTVRRRLSRAQSELERLRERVKLAAGDGPDTGEGLLVHAEAQAGANDKGLRWFPLSSVVRVIPADEVEGAAATCVDGAWVPVIGAEAPARVAGMHPTEAAEGRVALVIESSSGASSGRCVLPSVRVLGLVPWELARERGALLGPGV